MKRATALGLVGLTLLCTSAPAQNAPPAGTPSPEAVKAARTLLATTHIDENMTGAVDAMTPIVIQRLKRDKPDIPDDVIAKFVQSFRDDMKSSIPEVMDQEAQVY